MQENPVVIVSISRTPMGNLSGELKHFSGHELGSFAIKSAIERAHLKPSDIHECLDGMSASCRTIASPRTTGKYQCG